MTQLATSSTPSSAPRTNWSASGGDNTSTTLVVEVAGMASEDAVRAAASEVARIFPNSNDEKYGEPRAMG
jgi:hypothetical protein